MACNDVLMSLILSCFHPQETSPSGRGGMRTPRHGSTGRCLRWPWILLYASHFPPTATVRHIISRSSPLFSADFAKQASAPLSPPDFHDYPQLFQRSGQDHFRMSPCRAVSSHNVTREAAQKIHHKRAGYREKENLRPKFSHAACYEHKCGLTVGLRRRNCTRMV